ncbi:MAG TPA: NPCBM/NEW2 domain-containing protein [Kineosporiaceae bacterium]|nr:NPCBM/NEW2 domain-containing protein [Kineosporiaceae bacterium]
MKPRGTLLVTAALAVAAVGLSAPVAQAATGDLSVADYGATVNDTTDDTTAIQNAINAAISQNKARLLFAAGTYRISSTLNVNDSSGLTLQGATLTNGMPATTLKAAVTFPSSGQAAGQASGYPGITAYRNDNFAVKNFVGTADKTTAFYGTVSAVSASSITLTPLSANYRLPSTYTVDLQYLPVIDPNVGSSYRTASLGSSTKTFSNVAGTYDLRATGLTAKPNLNVGELVGFEIMRRYGEGFVDAYDGTNATFENIQVTNWISAPLAPRRILGNLTMRKIYAVPTDEYLNSGAGGICVCGEGGDVVLDQYQYFSGVAAEDALQQGPDLFEVESVSGTTVTFRSGAQSRTISAVNVGDTASFFKNNLADGVPTKVTLAVKPADEWATTLTFNSLPADVAVGSTFYFDKYRSTSFTMTNSDVNGRVYTLDNTTATGNNFTQYAISTMVDSINTGANTEGAYPQSVEVANNTFYEQGVRQALGATATPYAPMKDTSVHDNVFLNGATAQFDHVRNVSVTNNSSSTSSRVAAFGERVVDARETGTARLVPAGDGSLPNGGFESGSISPWTQTVGSGAVTTTEGGSTRLSLPGGYQVVKYTVTGLTPNTVYAFTGRAKEPTDGYTTWARVSRFGARDLLWSESKEIKTGGGWASFQIAFKTGPSRTTADLYLFRIGGTGVSLIDDLAVSKLVPASRATDASTYLSDLTPTSATAGSGSVRSDRSVEGNALRVDGATYTKGIGTHATSEIKYNLAKGYDRFKAKVGVDDEAGNNGSVVFRVFADDVKVYDSGVVTGATAVKDVDVDVRNVDTLKLVVTDAGDNLYWDHADWADARVLTQAGTYLSDLTWASASTDDGVVQKDKNHNGTTLTLDGTTYSKGLGTVPYSEIIYKLGAAHTRFRSKVGVDDAVGSYGSVVFQVFVDGVKQYDSGVMTGDTPAKDVDVPLSEAHELKLVVTDAGDFRYYDHPDWALARLLQ